MSSSFRFLHSFVLVLALALCTQPAIADTFYYVGDNGLPATLLPPPPAEGSASWKKEIADVHKAQSHVSKKDRAAMRAEQHVRLEMMTRVLGPDFTSQNYPNTFTLLDHALSDAENVSEADKAYWHTRRPYLADHKVKLLVDPIDKSPAYPSGHTTDARVIAEVLGLLYPEKRDAFRARADEIAWHRVEAGVHYPADLAGGRALAMLIMGAFMQSDDFNDDLAAAQIEIEQQREQQKP
jgi:acid phosphatase (class A)